MIVAAYALRGLAVLFRWLALPFVLVGWAAAYGASPFVWASGRCQNRAREWDPRLWERGQHTDLHAPTKTEGR